MFKKLAIRDFTYAAMFAALISVMSYVSVPLPFSPVPITGQTLAIMLAGCLLTTTQAALSISVYILLGVIGLPVFSGGSAGLGVLIGPKGGYLVGFLVGAIIISLLKGKNTNLYRFILANFVGGILAVYLVGLPWLKLMTGMPLQKAFMVGVLPFIPGDLFKVLCAAAVAVPLQSRLKKLSLI